MESVSYRLSTPAGLKGFEVEAHPDPNQELKARQLRFVVHDDVIVTYVRVMNDVTLDPAVQLLYVTA